MSSITEKRIDIIHVILEKSKNVKEFDIEFYKIMTEYEKQGENLWFSDNEREYYKKLMKVYGINIDS